MGWGVGWNEAIEGAHPSYLMARGLAAWTLSQVIGITPERADQYIGDEVVGFAKITPASMAMIMQSAYERAYRDKYPDREIPE